MRYRVFTIIVLLITVASMSWITVEIYNNSEVWIVPLFVVAFIVIVWFIFTTLYPMKKHKKQPPTYYDSILNKAEQQRKRKRME